MDQVKIGKFIASRRKECGMTQMQLAEHLGITDRAISKWENGRTMPDSSIMLDLCRLLHISVNDLLNGEVIEMEDYKKKTEELLVEIAAQKQAADKRLLSLEIVIGVLSMILLLGACVVAAYAELPTWARICLIVGGFIPCLVGIAYALRIEQTAGYYECAHCHHKYVPTYKSVFFAPHVNRTRYMRCPKCNKKSWQKKVLSKD